MRCLADGAGEEIMLDKKWNIGFNGPVITRLRKFIKVNNKNNKIKDKNLNSDQRDGRTKQLCFLMYDRLHFTHKKEYKNKVNKPKFICQNCYRTAAKDQDLCKPDKL